MATSKDVHRITLSSDEVFALVNLMDSARGSIGLDPTLSELYVKVDTKAYAIGKGHAKPAYVATGIRREAAASLAGLGAIPEGRKTDFDHMSEAEQFAELERLEAAMLAELSIGTDSPATDSDNVHIELMKANNSTK